MPKIKVFFYGFLTNTDSSILKVKLKHGFKIESKSLNEIEKFIETVDNVSINEASMIFTRDFPFYNRKENKVFFISNSFDIEIRDEKEFNIQRHILTNAYHNKFIDGYLENTIRIMRLFKEGNIYMPLFYYFFIKDKMPKKISSLLYKIHVSEDSIFKLSNSEIKNLEKFIEDVDIPFKNKSLKLAFDSFEMSYHMPPPLSISFLLLMISMESLFNPSNTGELRFRISRNSAVLIGKDKDDSKCIWKSMKNLYDKRCDMVHTGKFSHITKSDLLILRDYVRRSIKKFYKIGKSKKEILEMLNEIGFGEKL